jgi:MFS transporter, DHA2 family, multidrug resistance protein
MSEANAGAVPNAAPVSAGGSPWLIAVLIAVAAFMEVLDTTIVNVALNYIAGGLGVSEDESSWVVTTYLVANATIVLATSFFSRRFGRKAFFLTCLGLFTVSSVLCAVAWSLPALLLFRVMQGIAGGGMVPVSQAILADAFPSAKRGQAFALFGVAVVVAPVVGPTLGGWLSDNWSWHWCFLINAPVGLVAMALIGMILRDSPDAVAERRRLAGRSFRFDAVGFALVAIFFGTLEIMLDRGLDDDWFGSPFIVKAGIACAIAFVLLIPWELTRREPLVDLRMVATRQFGACLLVMLATGIILLATTQFLPELVQQDLGYTATWAGLVLSPGGLVTMTMFAIIGRVSGKVQPKHMIMVGALFVALSMYALTNAYGDLGFWFFAGVRALTGIGLPLIFLSITTASYDGIPPGKTDQAAALINAARNTGGSIGVSLVSNVLAHREQFHQSRLSEHVVASSPQFQDTLQHVTGYFAAHGSSIAESHGQAIAWIGQQVLQQASFLAYIDAFWVLMLIALSAVPLALVLRNVKLVGAAPVAH